MDILEQMDLMDLTDQEALDVFLNSGVDDADAAISPLPGTWTQGFSQSRGLERPLWNHSSMFHVNISGGK